MNYDREKVQLNYPNYSEIINSGIDKEKFNDYLESKINDEEFIKDMFNKMFI